MPIQCPRCGSRYLRDSQKPNATEKVRKWLFESALRCQDCKHRFIGRTFSLADLKYAHCPVCKRMDLNTWTGKTYTPTGKTAFKVNMGAKKWRCEYCRLNFASFRPRSEVFTFSRWKKLGVGDAVAEGRARVADIEAKNRQARDAEKDAAFSTRSSSDDTDE